MRVLLQRCNQAKVEVNGNVIGAIGKGILVLLGIETEDTQEDADWLIKKILNLRIFNDDAGVMNFSLADVKGELLVVSQFTLHAKTKKGNRPSYIRAAQPEVAIPLYEHFLHQLKLEIGDRLQTGEFGAMMQVSLTNDGPVTIWIDSKAKE